MSPQVLLRGGGRQCETVAGLDHKDTMEYVSGQQVIRVVISSGTTDQDHCYHHWHDHHQFDHHDDNDDDVQVMFDGEPDEGLSDGLTGCYKVST